MATQRSLEVRKKRAEIKQALTLDAITLEEVFEHSDEGDHIYGGIRVRAALSSIPGISKAGADRIMATIGIHKSLTIKATGHRQRAELLAFLDR